VVLLYSSVTSLATPPRAPEAVRLLQPNAPQPLTLLRPFILGGLLPVGIEPPTLTFNTPGKPADATSCAAAQLVASAGEPEVLKVRLGVRFPLATTHPV